MWEFRRLSAFAIVCLCAFTTASASATTSATASATATASASESASEAAPAAVPVAAPVTASAGSFTDGEIRAINDENAELTMRLNTLEAQVARLSARTATPPQVISLRPILGIDYLHSQLGPVASKIYFDKQASWQLGVSSEVLTFQEKRGAGGSAEGVNRANVLSVSPVLAFRLHPRVIFNSQFNFENGGSESSNTVALQKGQSIVTQAYVDWLSSADATSGIRAGHQLVPVGWINTRNEPVTYLSVMKPELERELIPSSWHENGIALWAERPRADLQIGIFNSLDAGEYKGETFLAGGRSQGQNARADDVMLAARMNFTFSSLLLGGSLAFGNSAQGDPALRNSSFNLAEAHARLRWRRLELFGQVVRGQVNDAEAISIMNGTTMGQMARGYQVQAAFDLLAGERGLWAFARYSDYNLHEQVALGYSADPALDKQQLTYGLAYFPLPYLSLKADYAQRSNGDDSAEDEFALGLGIVF